MKIKGTRALIKNLENIVSSGQASYRHALSVVLLNIEAESMRRTPVDTGNLRASGAGNARIISSSRNGARGSVSYTADYAIHVHENTDSSHTVGEAKFLENAIKHVVPSIENDIGNSIKNRMFKGK